MTLVLGICPGCGRRMGVRTSRGIFTTCVRASRPTPDDLAADSGTRASRDERASTGMHVPSSTAGGALPVGVRRRASARSKPVPATER